jgi:hypothetical protein
VGVVRAIVWKEVREQGLIALTLLVLGSGILVAAAVLADPPSPGASPADVVGYLGAGRLATLLLAVTAGTVCGGALFAAEREAGTMGFLESLPASRWDLWRAKLLAGLAVVSGEVAVVLGVSAVLGLVPRPAWAAEVALYSLQAFAWGAYGSTLTRTTLGSVGVAIPSAVVAGVAFMLPIVLFVHGPGPHAPKPEVGLLFLALMFVTPLGVSLAVFTHPDRTRSAEDLTRPKWVVRPADLPPTAAPAATSARPRHGLKALVWLACQQLMGPGAAISGLALAAGVLLLAPTVYPFLSWPTLALAAGVLAGVSVFADEQAGRSAAFWGEQRLPVGRAWAVKVAVHLLFAAWLLALLALPSVLRAAAEPGPTRGYLFASAVFRSHLADQLRGQIWKYLLVPAVYGFAAATLCGMLFRKAVVAAGVAGLVGGTAAALWVPSLLAGGLSHWQVWLPPAAAVLTGWLLARAWSAERLTTRGPLGVLAAGVAAALLVQAAGIGYRVVEIPDKPDAEDDVRFVATLPEVGREIEGGRNFRTAADKVSRLIEDVARRPDRPAGPRRFAERVEKVPADGWPADDTDFSNWLDDLYKLREQPGGVAVEDKPWYELASAAAAAPTVGIYEHPLLIGVPLTTQAIDQARRMAAVVLARGLQRQAAGDPAEFVTSLWVTLRLAASLRNQSIVTALHSGHAVERSAADAVWWWLKEMDADPDRGAEREKVLRDAVAVLLAADDVPPFDPRPHLLAERHVLREALRAPAQFVGPRHTPARDTTANPEGDLVAFAWTVPWERERTRRLLGLGFEGGPRPAEAALVGDRPAAWETLLIRRPGASELRADDRMIRAVRRGTLLRVAVRLHEELTGRPPAALDDLVTAGCLPAIPADPFDGRPFRYRPSPAAPVWALEFDLPVVWSVGPNRVDEGGRSARAGRGLPNQPDDVAFSVPPRRRP